MNREIMELVSKNLPAMQVEALRGELTKAAAYEEVKKTLEQRDACIKEYQTKLAAAEDRNRRIDSLEAKQAELDKKEQRLEVELLKKDVANKDYCIGMQKELMQCVFRNPSYTRYTSGQAPAGNGSSMTVCTNQSETTTQE